jgi:hypothetical protein
LHGFLLAIGNEGDVSVVWTNIFLLGRKARLAVRLPAYGGQATIDIYIKKDINKIIYIKILIQYEFC